MTIAVVCPQARHLYPSPPKPGVPGGPVESRRFPRKSRLRKHADFEKVYRDGQRIFSANMTVFFSPREGGPARIGFTVGRVLGGAVERNRIRRRMREAVRLNLPAIGGGIDAVIHPKKSALRADFQELREEVGKAFEKILVSRKP